MPLSFQVPDYDISTINLALYPALNATQAAHMDKRRNICRLGNRLRQSTLIGNLLLLFRQHDIRIVFSFVYVDG
jgi:hypothetical protein